MVAVRAGTVVGMIPELTALVERGGGLVTRALAGQVVPTWAVENACRGGDLRRMLPGVYRAATTPVTPMLKRRAALAWLAGRGALSHTTALAVWGLYDPSPGDPPWYDPSPGDPSRYDPSPGDPSRYDPTPNVPAPDELVHVTVPAVVRLRPQPGVTVHRRSRFVPEPPHVRVRAGQLVTPIERSLVDAWPLLPAADRRAPVIRAVNDRLTMPDRVRAALGTVPKLPGRAELARLLDLLIAGCRSPLEIFGHEHVFTAPGMPEFQRQVKIELRTRVVYLDVYDPETCTNFELDGASVHGSRRQREIDLRRDAMLATLGILVVRFTHRRLVYETEAVMREILAILDRRHRMLS